MTKDEHGWSWRKVNGYVDDLSEGWDGHWLKVHYVSESPDECEYAIVEIGMCGISLRGQMFGWRCGTPLPEPEEVETFTSLHKVRRWCVEDDEHWRTHGKGKPKEPEILYP